MNVVKLN